MDIFLFPPDAIVGGARLGTRGAKVERLAVTAHVVVSSAVARADATARIDEAIRPALVPVSHLSTPVGYVPRPPRRPRRHGSGIHASWRVRDLPAIPGRTDALSRG